MNIRPKQNIIKAATGIKFSLGNANGANWRQLVFDRYRLHLLDKLAAYGEADDYGDWLNEMLRRHANLYNSAGNNWLNIAYKDSKVGEYQQDYRGGLGNNGLLLRFGLIKLKPEDNFDFNEYGILPNQNLRYIISNPPQRISGDFRRGNYNFNIDNLYSAITDDRRLLGRKGDWDDLSLLLWNNELKSRGWEMYLDPTDSYYKLKRFGKTPRNPIEPVTPLPIPTPIEKPNLTPIDQILNSPEWKKKLEGTTKITGSHSDKSKFDWSKISDSAQRILSNPNMYALGRLAGNLVNNERVYGEMLKGISPTLRLTYNTYRQVVGDEATKQGFYRRAVLGLQKAARPFTSDADRQMAYLMEAKRIGDELRAQGDLADNQEIRRTSDESNLHQWANAQRATEVANANIASINQSNSTKHKLLAQKHSALWSSIDNFLQGLETRKRQRLAEQLAIDDLIFTLLEKLNLQEDPEYLQAYKDYSDIIKAHTDETTGIIDSTNEDVLNARRKLQKAQTEALTRSYERRKKYYLNRSIYGKSGTKITHKKKDDLLYKSAKDVVEHFRKMSKLLLESLKIKSPKIEKLTSHPKSRKFLEGGVAPFTIYKPVALGGETSRQTTTSGSGRTSDKDSSGLDLLKELFKSLLVEGLPSDVNGIYAAMNALMQKQEMFGTELSSDDIASMYIQQMLKINTIKFNKKLYDDISKIVNEKGAISEYAIDQNGRIAVLDNESNQITYKPWDEVKENLDKYNPLTNGDLLNLRAYSILKAFDNNMLLVVGNATSMEEISKFIKSNLPKIESTQMEGYTKHEQGQIKAGLELLKEAPSGEYSVKTEENAKQVLAAVSFVYGMLPKNMKTLLRVNSEMLGVSMTNMLSSLILSNTLFKLEFTPVTGKGASSGKGSGKGTETPAVVLFLLGNGNLEMIEFNIGNSQSVKALGRFGVLLDKQGNNLGQGKTFLDVSSSLFGPVLDLNKATFGGTRLNENGYSHIIINNSDVVSVELPVTVDSSGNYVPDFLLTAAIEKAEETIRNNNITDKNQINKIYNDNGLPLKYDNNGNTIPRNYRRFAAILVTLDEKALKGGAPINLNEVTEADDLERELFIESMQQLGIKDFDLDNGFLWTSWGRNNLYKGTIFVPVREDLVGGFISGGQPLDTDLPNDSNSLEMLQHTRMSEYKQVPTLSQIKNN